MRALLVCAMLCGCSGRQSTRLLFERVPTAELARPRTINLDFAALDRDDFRIGLGQQTLVPRDLVRRPLPNGALVHGTLAGGGTLIFARSGTAVTGVIRLGAKGFEVQPVPGGHRLVPRSWKTPRQLHEQWNAISAARGPRLAPKPSTELVQIDIQFSYTQKVEEQRTLDGIRGHIATAITQLDNACKAAGVRVQFRAVGEPVKTTGTEAGKTIYQIYSDLYQRKDFLDAHAARKDARADILVLLVDKVQGGLGLGTIMATPETAIAVADHHDSLWALTIPHEIGHIMGGLHEDDDTDDPYKWGHAYVGNGVRTIMSNPCADCVLLERWSAPPELGDPAERDNARVLRDTAPTIATYGDAL